MYYCIVSIGSNPTASRTNIGLYLLPPSSFISIGFYPTAASSAAPSPTYRPSLKGFRPWAVGVGLLYLAFSPLVYHTVTEFRPDYPSAIFTIWGVLLYLEFLRRGSWKYAAFSGVCYGLAMLAKPPVFLYVMAIGGAPFLLGLGHRSGEPEKNDRKECGKGSMSVAVTALKRI